MRSWRLVSGFPHVLHRVWIDRNATEGKLRHGGHPILAWMADHVEVEEDAHGNIRPSKRRSAERIDGIVALIMAIKRWQAHLEPSPSVYEERGLLEF